MIKIPTLGSVFRRAIFCGAVLSMPFVLHAQQKSEPRILNSKLLHLGGTVVNPVRDASASPAGDRLDLKFDADLIKNETTLELTYWYLNNSAMVEINGKKLGALPPSQNRKEVFLRVPAGTLRMRGNILSVIPRAKDDCVIGKITLHDKPFRQLMDLELVRISVKDETSGKALPARVTIVDAKGGATEIFLTPKDGTAVRAGLIYVSEKETEIALRKGDYIFYANRGSEWSRDKQTVSVESGRAQKVILHLRREVDTTGFIACDTHIHTLTFSGHGDATVEERIVTLAGEGVELAVATDHNHHTDYRPYQKKLGMNSYFTPVIGNEVTTKFGHINGFPMPLNGQIPDFNETNWIKLVEDIRFRGAKVVILNHPRWKKYDVFKDLGFNTLTGEQAVYDHLPFDGLELANSGSLRKDPLQLFGDFFALLNHGENIKAVGSSDSHAVLPPVGQGRTYIRSSTDNPAKINIDEICANFLAGKSSISLGMFADVLVENQFTEGALVPAKNPQVQIKFRVAAPGWVMPQRALVFLNGVKVAEQKLSPDGKMAFDRQLEFSIPTPKHDAHLVCVALGDGVKESFWTTEENYTLAATNPVFLDADNDGVYRSPRETAKAILARTGKNLEAQWNTLDSVDDAIAAQVLSLIYKNPDGIMKRELRERLQQNATRRPVFGKFLALPGAEK